MPQATTWGMHTEPPAPPTAVAIRINESFNALLSMHSGTSAPAYAVKGTWWLDISASPHPIKIYDGASWITVATMDATAHTIDWGASAIAIGDVTGLQDALDAKVPTSRTVSAGGLLSGGGALSGNITITGTGASQAEAEAGVNNANLMTALRTAQAIAALATPAAIGAVPTSQTATEATAGIIRKATEAEALALVSDVGAVTPAKLGAVVAALGGGLELIGQTLTNGLGNVDFTDLGGYSIILAMIVIASHDSGSNRYLRARTSTDNGSTFASSNGNYKDGVSSSLDNMPIMLTAGVAAGTIVTGFCIFAGMEASGIRTTMMSLGFGTNAFGCAFRDAEEVNNAIRFSWSAGNFDQGKIRLYGLAI